MSITYRPGRCVKWRSHLHPVGCFKLLWRHSNFTSVATSNSSWPYAGSGSLKRWMALVKPTSYRSYGDQHHSPSIHHVTSCTDFHLDEALMKRWRFPRKRQMDFRRSRSAMISGSAKHMDCPVLLVTWWETTHFQHLWFGRVTVCQASAFAKMLSGSFPKICGFKALRLCTFLQTFQAMEILRGQDVYQDRFMFLIDQDLGFSGRIQGFQWFSMVFNGFQWFSVHPPLSWVKSSEPDQPSEPLRLAMCCWHCWHRLRTPTLVLTWTTSTPKNPRESQRVTFFGQGWAMLLREPPIFQASTTPDSARNSSPAAPANIEGTSLKKT